MTPTQAKIIERHKRFHALIASRAVPDEAECVRPSVIVAKPSVQVVKHKEEPGRKIRGRKRGKPKPIALRNPHVSDIPTPIQRIQRAVCAYYRISLAELHSPSRAMNFAIPRHVSYWLTVNDAKQSYLQTCRQHSRTNHTTVRSSILKMRRLLEQDHKLVDDIAELRRHIGPIFASGIVEKRE